MTRHRVKSATALASLVVVIGVDIANADDVPENWSRSITIDGVPNLFQVNERLYRSAQPSAEGMVRLKERGVVTIVNLRSFGSDRDEIGSTGLAYEQIYMKAWHPERHEAVRFLQIVNDSKRTPVLVHCRFGADRTGAMIALYRVAVEGWCKEDAIDEMTDPRHGFNPLWVNLPEWIRGLDIDAIREEAGIEDPAPKWPPCEPVEAPIPRIAA